MFEKFDKLVKLALEAGFEKAEVFATASESFSVNVYEGQIEDYRVEKRAGIALRGLMNGQMGYASTEVDEESEYADLVARAKENAMLLESKDVQFIYDGKEKLEWLSSANKELYNVTAEEKIALAMEMEKACFALWRWWVWCLCPACSREIRKAVSWVWRWVWVRRCSTHR